MTGLDKPVECGKLILIFFMKAELHRTPDNLRDLAPNEVFDERISHVDA